MRFNLNQAYISPKTEPLLLREIRRHQKELELTPLSQKNLRELVGILNSIEKNGIPNYLVCKKLNAMLGYGIFLHPDAKSLTKGQVVAPYSGEISLIPQNAYDPSTYAFNLINGIRLEKEEQFKWDKQNQFHPNRLYSFKLDAMKKGNFTRYINHSEAPNLIAYMVSIPKNIYGVPPSPLEVVYFVNKKIHPGEQLLISYEEGEKSYWNTTTGKPLPMTPQAFKLNSDLRVYRK